MKKLLALVMILGLVAVANANVISLVIPGEDALPDGSYNLPAGTYDVAIVVGSNPFIYNGEPYPDYDGFVLSSFDVSLTCTAGVALQEDLSGPVFDPSNFDFGDGVSGAWSGVASGNVPQLTGVSLDGVLGGGTVVSGLQVIYNGGVATVDMALNGLSEYAADQAGSPWLAMEECDLGDLNFVPEPFSMSLLALGGLVAIRRRRA